LNLRRSTLTAPSSPLPSGTNVPGSGVKQRAPTKKFGSKYESLAPRFASTCGQIRNRRNTQPSLYTYPILKEGNRNEDMLGSSRVHCHCGESFQTAKVVSIDHIPADARHPEKADQYKVAMRLGDTVYLCQSSAPASAFLDWSPNKEFPAKLDGKMLLVNGPHGPVTLTISGKKTAK
jgi:hypothetical protein